MNKDSFRFTSEVTLIDSDGHNQGRIKVQEAQRIAFDSGLDLIEVSKIDGISVCRIMDYGKWKYERNKKRKHQKSSNPTTKEMKFGMRIEKHDQQTKIDHISHFLEKGHPVRMVVEMRGRERAYPRLAMDKMDGMIAELRGSFKDFDDIRKTKGNVSTLLHPNKDTRNGQNNTERSSKEKTTPPQKSGTGG